MTELQKYCKSKLNLHTSKIMWREHEIMARWEEPVIKRSVDLICQHLRPLTVLELGFGYGFTAEVFQKYAHKHVVVEIHPEIAQDARDRGFEVIEKDATRYLSEEKWDLVYDDLYPLSTAKVNYANLNPNYVATMFHTYDVKTQGFHFSVHGVTYFQPLYPFHEDRSIH